MSIGSSPQERTRLLIPEIPRWVTETPKQVRADSFIGLGTFPVAGGQAVFVDGETVNIAIKIAKKGDLRADRQTETTDKIRTAYQQLFPEEPLPLIYSRTFNSATTVPVDFVDRITDRSYLLHSSLQDWRAEYVSKQFPSNNEIVVMENIQTNSWESLFRALRNHPDQASDVFNRSIRQYFQLLIALHSAGITHNDRKLGEDSYYNLDQQRLLVLDWDVPQPAAPVTMLNDIRTGLQFSEELTRESRISPSARTNLSEVAKVIAALNQTTRINTRSVYRSTSNITIETKKGYITAQECLRIINRAIIGELLDTIQPDIDKLVKSEKIDIPDEQPLELTQLGASLLLERYNLGRHDHIIAGAIISSIYNNQPLASLEYLKELARHTGNAEFQATHAFLQSISDRTNGNSSLPRGVYPEFMKDYYLCLLRPDLATSANRQRLAASWQKLGEHINTQSLPGSKSVQQFIGSVISREASHAVPSTPVEPQSEITDLQRKAKIRELLSNSFVLEYLWGYLCKDIMNSDDRGKLLASMPELDRSLKTRFADPLLFLHDLNCYINGFVVRNPQLFARYPKSLRNANIKRVYDCLLFENETPVSTRAEVQKYFQQLSQDPEIREGFLNTHLVPQAIQSVLSPTS